MQSTMIKQFQRASKSGCSKSMTGDAPNAQENLITNSKQSLITRSHWSWEESTGKATFVPSADPAIKSRREPISLSERRRMQQYEKNNLGPKRKAGDRKATVTTGRPDDTKGKKNERE